MHVNTSRYGEKKTRQELARQAFARAQDDFLITQDFEALAFHIKTYRAYIEDEDELQGNKDEQ